MCGINGIAFSSGSGQQINRRVLERMRDSIVYRGPDDAGIFTDENIGLGHRRLSIVDLAHGHQPMANADESLVIVYNGEVYNHADFVRELVAAHNAGENNATRIFRLVNFEIWQRQFIDGEKFEDKNHSAQADILAV